MKLFFYYNLNYEILLFLRQIFLIFIIIIKFTVGVRMHSGVIIAFFTLLVQFTQINAKF